MAKQKKDTTNPKPDDEQEFTEETFVPEDVQAMDLARQYAGEEGISLRIYRQLKGGYRDLEFLLEMQPSEFTPSLLQEEPYNGGKFRLHFVSPTGFVANKGITIASRPTVKPAQPDALQPVMQVMMDGFSKMADAMKAMVPQSQSRADMLGELKLMAEFLRPQNAGNGGVIGELETVRKVFDLVKTLTPNPVVAVGESGEVNTGQTMLNIFDKFLTSVMEAKRGEAAPQPVQGTLNAPVEKEIPSQLEDDALNEIRMFSRMLCKQASVGGDVEIYANMVLDNAEEKAILEFINSADWFEKLVSFEPDIGKFRPWFDELRNAIIEMTTPDPDEIAAAKAAEGAALTVAPGSGTVAGDGSASAPIQPAPDADAALTT